MKKIKLLTVSCFIAGAINSQTCFNPGNGSGGAYIATTNTTLAGGSYSFTTFDINPGVVVNVTGNAPLMVHCTGAVTINGTLTANGGNGTNGVTSSTAGVGGIGVAGGGNGGNGSYSSSVGPLNGVSGSGPGAVNNLGAGWSGGGGGGYATVGNSSGGVGGFGGPAYGNVNVTNLDPGSGGGGGSGGYSCGAGGGGAGGGVIVFNSGASIIIYAAGAISSKGGDGGTDDFGNCGGGGGGSGGTIWLAAATLTNNGIINAVGGTGGASNVPGNPYYGTGANGANGRIRIDVNGPIAGTGTIQPAAGSTYSVPTAPLMAMITSTNACGTATSGIATVTGSNGVAAYTYSWLPTNSTNATITNLAPGTYTSIVTDAAFCIITQTINILTGPDPTLSVTSSNSLICTGQSATLTALTSTDVTNYNWTPSGNTNSLVVSPTVTTSYSIVVSSSITGCSATATVSQAVSLCTGLADNISNSLKAVAYPNPNTGNFELQLIDPSEVLIYNLLGEVFMKDNFTEGKHPINISNVASGIYFVKVTERGNSQVIKIVKQ